MDLILDPLTVAMEIREQLASEKRFVDSIRNLLSSKLFRKKYCSLKK